jgi:hypothetical protein
MQYAGRCQNDFTIHAYWDRRAGLREDDPREQHAVLDGHGDRPELGAVKALVDPQQRRLVVVVLPGGARNRHFGLLSTLRAHANPPYKTVLLWETRMVLTRPGWARTVNCEPTKAIIVALVRTAAYPNMLSTEYHEPMSAAWLQVGR